MFKKLKTFFENFRSDYYEHKKQYTIIISITVALFLAFVITLGVQIYRCGSAAYRINHTQTQLTDVKAKLAADPVIVGDEFAVDALQRIFGSDQLALHTDKCWDYKIQINGKEVTDDTVKVSKNETVTVTLKEIYTESKFPDDVEMFGRVTGNDTRTDVSNYISVSHGANIIPVKLQKDNVYTLTYSVKGLKSGDEVVVKMKPMLTQQMDLPDDVAMYGKITIKVS
ncbi:MAG: hypothetical protein IJF54_07135 [Clostridia bacterium]|nr:hypothetical protein [Clostridia bacterium]